MTETEIRVIEEIIQPLLGRKAWGVKSGVGSFITLEFGAPTTPYKQHPEWVHGEWHLWVMHCAWLVSQGPEFVAASEDTDVRTAGALQRMEGRSLTSVVIVPPALDTTITFGEDVVLRLFPRSGRYEHWNLFTPDGNVLIIGPGSHWFYIGADEPLGLDQLSNGVHESSIHRGGGDAHHGI